MEGWRGSSVCIDGITLLATALLALATMLLTSDVTDMGRDLHNFLDDCLHLKLWIAAASALLVCMMLLVYVADMVYWESHGYLRAAYYLCLGLYVFAYLMLLTPLLPVAPILGGFLVTLVVWRLEKWLFALNTTEGMLMPYLRAVRRACLAVAALLVACWLAWLVLRFEKWVDFDFMKSDDGVVRFASPLLLAFDYATIAVCVEIRAKFEKGKKEDSSSPLPVANFFHGVLIVMIVVVVLVNAMIALSSFDHLFGIAAYCYSIGTALFILVYTGYMVGLRRILEIAKTDDFASALVYFLQGDIMKALLVLALLPLSPLIFAIDAWHQATRKCLWRCGGVLKDDPGRECLTREMRGGLDADLASILSLSMWAGLALVVARLFAAFLPPLMAQLNLYLADQSWPLVVFVSFTVAIVLFLLPPVSGQMIYIPISMMIISKFCGDRIDSYAELAQAVAIATIYCLLMKLAGSAMQQKAIGEPMSTSIPIKKAFQLHTPMYRVARYVLSQPGPSLEKMAVLTGMPDWPVSVLCGILGLPLCPIMLCTLPEAVKILPNCCAVGFILKSQGAAGSEESTLSTLSTVCFALGVGIPGALSVLVSFIVKRLMAEHKDEFTDEKSDWHRDPQEEEILEAIAEDEARSAAVKQLTHWSVQPCWVRALLLAGALLASLATYTNLLGPFESFDFKDPNAIDDLPGGSVAGLFLRPGYAMLALAGGMCACMAAYQSWYLLTARAAHKPESEGLLDSRDASSGTPASAASSSSSSPRGAR